MEILGPSHPVMTLQNDLLCLVPIAILHGTLEIRAMVTV